MTRILLSGCCGRMGKNVINSVNNRKDTEIIAGVDIIEDSSLGFPVFQSFDEVSVKADVIIDFSNCSAIDSLLAFAVKTKTPAVICSTGLSDEQTAHIKAAAETIPVFFSFNMSLGVNLICELSKAAAKVLGSNFDVEIVEAHHNQKLDAPSGTAVMLANAVKEVMPDAYCEYDRHSKRAKRNTNEIGILSIRGGNIVGEHEVIFAGNDEIVKISHSARSRGIFAEGAVNAAIFVCDKDNGLYTMTDLINA